MSSDTTVLTNKRTRLRDFMDAVVRSRNYSGSVLVAEQDETLLRAAYGMANVELKVPNTPQTKFRIGSITKQFTAMIVLILVEQGKLSLEDRLIDRLPDMPSRWSQIRVHHLLNFTSGLIHSWDIPGFQEKVMVPYPLAAMIEDIKNAPLLFAPGESCHYTGIGYFMLARIVERAVGQSFEALARKVIFDPVGMENSGADSHTEIIPRRAAGYVHLAGRTENAPFIHMQNLTGGGNLYSTVDDLARWDRTLNAGSLISPESYRAMYTPGKEDFGYGWKVRQKNSATVLGAGGGVNGFRAYFWRAPERGICVIVLSNNEETAEYLMEMVEGLHEIVRAD